MAQVRLSINGRSYRLECDDGSRMRFDDIAEYVNATVDGVIDEFGQVGHDQILLLAALKLADELFDAQGVTDTSDASTDDGADLPAAEERKAG
ncbi:MAG: cell division protein ZapA [Pseudomonadota bacterium]